MADRLDKYISKALNITRSEAKNLIKSKKVEIDGSVITDCSEMVVEKVKVNGKDINYKDKIYLMMNKPKGYVSATSDKEHPCVLDLVKEYKELKIVGRLDIDTEGLLLLTNDGDLIHELTSPKKDIYKKYFVEIDGMFTCDMIDKFKNGFDILDNDNKLFHTKEAKLEIIDSTHAYISISEGKFHQIKKMCHEVGGVVKSLKRVEIGDLKLDERLESGKYRELGDKELEKIKGVK